MKEACFIYGGEIYYIEGAKDEDIEYDLMSMVEAAMRGEYDNNESIMFQAQRCLIQKQSKAIKDNYCE